MSEYVRICSMCSVVLDDSVDHVCNFLNLSQTGNQVPRSSPTTPSFTWHERPTKLLIAMYGEKKADLNSPHIKKKMVWGEIAEVLKEKGYSVSGVQVENKIKALVNAYKKAKDNNKQSGNARKSSPYYEELDEILAGSPDIQPVSGASSLSGYWVRAPSENAAPEGASDEPSTPESGSSQRRGRKRRLPEEEPLWFKEYREKTEEYRERTQAQRQKNHEERLVVQREFMNVLKEMSQNINQNK